MVSALGINVQLVFAAAFFLGAMLAGLGGVLGGTMISLAPGEDTSFLLNSLIVVIIGGMGSLGGAAIGALALGLVDAYADVYLVFGDTDLTNYSILVTFAPAGGRARGPPARAVREAGVTAASPGARAGPALAVVVGAGGARPARLHRLLPVGDPHQVAVARRGGGEPDLPVGVRRHGVAGAGGHLRRRRHDLREPGARRRRARGRVGALAARRSPRSSIATAVGLALRRRSPRAASASTS